MNASEPSMKCRENAPPVKNCGGLYTMPSVAVICLLATRQASRRRHELYLGFQREQRKSHINAKGTIQAGERPARQNTDVLCDGRLLRSSDEAPVMGVERRG